MKKRFNIGDTHLEHNTIVYPVPHLQHNKYLYKGYDNHQNYNNQYMQQNSNQQNYNPHMQNQNLSKSLVLPGNNIIQ